MDLGSLGSKAESTGLGKSKRVARFENYCCRAGVLSWESFPPPGDIWQHLELTLSVLTGARGGEAAIGI